MADARVAAEATSRNKLEQEAPIRGLAKYVFLALIVTNEENWWKHTRSTLVLKNMWYGRCDVVTPSSGSEICIKEPEVETVLRI